MQHPTDHEIRWAQDLRQAAQEDPVVRHKEISDLEYLQHAVIAKGEPVEALERVKRLQTFKERYGITKDGSYHDGIRDLKAFLQANPGVVLAVAELPDHSHVIAIDMGKSQKATSSESLAVSARASFYLLQACQSSYQAITAGVASLSDFGNITWRRNISCPWEELSTSMHSRAYPIRILEIVLLNTNLVLQTFYSFFRRFLPKKARERSVMPGDLQAYLQEKTFVYPPDVLPKAWGGNLDAQNILDTLDAKLRSRYELADKYCLPQD